MKLNSYKELAVWQKSIKLVTNIYETTSKYPKTEIYGLANQTRRAAVSIASNIAEGWTREHLAEYVQFLRIALGSAAELETQLLIARNLSFLGDKEFPKLIGNTIEIMKMLNGLISKLRKV